MQPTIQSKKSKNAENRRRRKKIFFWFLVLCVLAFVAIIIFALKTPKLSISDISVSGIETMQADSIISQARKTISGKYLFFFPKDNVIVYPDKKIIENILSLDSRIMEASVSVDRKRVLHISIKEYTPFFAWCHSQKCFYTDESGYIFRAIDYDPKNFFIVFRNGANKDNPIGSYWADGDMENIKDMIEFFKVIEMPVKEISFMGNSDYYFYIENGTEFRVDFDGSIETTQSYLDIFITQNLDFIKNSDFEYVDARFGKKIYYKEKQGGEKSNTESSI